GLGAAPTLANLASRTLLAPEFALSRVDVFNVQRDEPRVYATDVAVIEEEEDEEITPAAPAAEAAPAPAPAAPAAEAAPAPAA
ncbi:hypothetical protein Q0P33_14355, partial [Staphylococcus aureus]|nr:hypothetical protein [Staphylococcus aureus]